MPKRTNKKKRRIAPSRTPTAETAGKRLRSYTVGALPIINDILDRMDLKRILEEHLPPDDKRVRLPTSSGLLLLVRNILLSREPLYGVREWAVRHAPDLLGLTEEQLDHVNDDCLARRLSRLFAAMAPQLVLDVLRQVTKSFHLSLDQLHNDSTTVTLHGDYSEAAEEGTCRGRPTIAITWGNNKDHRPDLKQLLYILTVSNDGGVPVYFTTASGNTADDTTHCETWDVLRQLVGRSDFLYVADCKLASTENMKYIANSGGRFVTVLPATRKENREFREMLASSARRASWRPIHEVWDSESEQLVDRFSVWADPRLSAEGYRLLWYHSLRKAEQDRMARVKRVQRAVAALETLRTRLGGPRTRLRHEDQVWEAVAKILDEQDVRQWVNVQLHESEEVSYRQATRGRPGKKTRYVKQSKVRYDISWEIHIEQVVEGQANDGVFPLLTNTVDLTSKEVLLAYKRQPVIEKRFSQLKTDYGVAPVYLNDVGRIQALMCIYFLVLLVEALLERELRQAMERAEEGALPLYPEGRSCRRPTTRRLIDVFEPVQRHVLMLPDGKEHVFVTELSDPQQQVLALLQLGQAGYGWPSAF